MGLLFLRHRAVPVDDEGDRIEGVGGMVEKDVRVVTVSTEEDFEMQVLRCGASCPSSHGGAINSKSATGIPPLCAVISYANGHLVPILAFNGKSHSQLVSGPSELKAANILGVCVHH